MQNLKKRNKIFDFTSIIFLNNVIKKFVAKRIIQSARKHDMTFIFKVSCPPSPRISRSPGPRVFPRGGYVSNWKVLDGI